MALTISSPILEALARRKAQQEALRQQGAGAIGMLGGGIAAGQAAQDKAQQQANTDRVALRLENEAQAARAQEAVTNQRNAAADARAGTELQLRLAQDERAATAAASAEERAAVEAKAKATARETEARDRFVDAQIDAAIERGEPPDELASRLLDMPQARVGDSGLGSSEVLARYQNRKRARIAEDAALAAVEAGTDQKAALAEKARRKPASADPNKPGSKGAKGEDALRKEFNALPAVKKYRDVEVSMDQMRRNAAEDSAAGDMALIYAFMRGQDPESTVREGEFRSAEVSGSILDRATVALKKVTSGERLTASQRADFLAIAAQSLEARRAAYEAEVARYGGIVQRRGLTQENVLPSGAAPAPAATATPSEARAKMDAWAGG